MIAQDQAFKARHKGTMLSAIFTMLMAACAVCLFSSVKCARAINLLTPMPWYTPSPAQTDTSNSYVSAPLRPSPSPDYLHDSSKHPTEEEEKWIDDFKANLKKLSGAAPVVAFDFVSVADDGLRMVFYTVNQRNITDVIYLYEKNETVNVGIFIRNIFRTPTQTDPRFYLFLSIMHTLDSDSSIYQKNSLAYEVLNSVLDAYDTKSASNWRKQQGRLSCYGSYEDMTQTSIAIISTEDPVIDYGEYFGILEKLWIDKLVNNLKKKGDAYPSVRFHDYQINEKKEREIVYIVDFKELYYFITLNDVTIHKDEPMGLGILIDIPWDETGTEFLVPAAEFIQSVIETINPLSPADETDPIVTEMITAIINDYNGEAEDLWHGKKYSMLYTSWYDREAVMGLIYIVTGPSPSL